MTADIMTFFSRPRMATYTLHCGGDEGRALQLYRANAHLSGVGHMAVQYFEVILRNALDRELRSWNLDTHGRAEWTLDPTPLLVTVVSEGRLRTARADAARAIGSRRPIEHDDVVAQLSFGAWRNLLPSLRHPWKQRLWDEALQHAFANRQQVRADQISASVAIVYDFRNRIAHHEPIFGMDLRGKRRAMRDVLNSVSPAARRWFVGNELLSAALDDFYADWPELERKN